MSDSSTVVPVVAILFAIYLISKRFSVTTYKLKHIPTIGSSGVISSYLNAVRFFQHGHEMIQEGYDKYYGSAFKVPNLSRWLVVVSGPQMIDDIRRASDDQVSFNEAIAEMIQTDYTLGSQIRLEPYHIPVVRTSLTRNIATRFADIKNEIVAAFGDLIPVTDDNEWATVPVLKTTMRIVGRTTNRFYFGLPLCRNIEYLELQERFAIDLYIAARIINMFPGVFKPIVGRVLTKVPANIKRAVSHVGPLIQAHLEEEKQYGKDWPEKPNNLISWLLDEAQGPQRTVNELVVRILAGNAAAIINISNVFTDVVYDLAAHPEYVAAMREEVETVIEADGWTKASIGKMLKVDSFVKESQRIGIGGVSMVRRVMKDFTFSNGVTLPAGTDIAVATQSTHMDKKFYDNPQKFQGFRFAGMADEEGEGSKHQLVSLNPDLDFLGFGVGNHACPGRFLAAIQLKAMLAHILVYYDVKLLNDGTRPESSWFFGVAWPNRTAEVMFRKRA